MLAFRADQIEAFTAERHAEYLTRLVTHLRAHFPDRLAAQTDEQVRAHGLDCLARAAGYGLTHEQAVASYAQLPLVLGDGFESDPHYRPLADLLGDR